MHKFSLRLVAICGLACSTFCQAENNVSELNLSNGLKVIVKEDHRAPVVMSLLMYHIGSSYEPAGITGVSHALEHMMFKGTPNTPKGEYSRIIADNGGSLNAFTSTDYTGYHVQIGKDKLPIVLKLEADRMENLNLDKQEFSKEIEVVKEERHLRTENVPDSLTFEQFQAAAYMGIPYHHPIVGWQSDLDNMEISDLRKWYKAWYRPNNATLVVVGDVDPKAVFALAKQYFEPIKPRTLPVVKPFKPVPTHGVRHVTVKRPAEVPLLLIGFNVPSATTATEAWEPYALNVLASIMSSGNSSRFAKKLVREQQVAASADASYGLYYRLPNLFILSGSPSEASDVKQLKAAMMKEVKTLQTQPISQGELNKIKALVIADDIYSQDSISRQATEIGVIESIGLSWQELDKYQQKINAVTPAQVQAVAKKYLIPDQMTIAVLKPEKRDSDTTTAQGAQ